MSTSEETHPNGRPPGRLSRDSAAENNVDKTECCAQVRREYFVFRVTLLVALECVAICFEGDRHTSARGDISRVTPLFDTLLP